jgi:hypothetical protein
MHPEEIVNAVGRLTGSDERDRAAAEKRLRALTSEDLRGLLRWAGIQELEKKAANGFAGCAAACCAIYGGAGLLVMLFVLISYAFDQAIPGIFVSCVALGMGWFARSLIRRRDPTVECSALSYIENPMAAVPILEALANPAVPYKDAAVAALVRLLPGLKAGDSMAFTFSARRTLDQVATHDSGLYAEPLGMAAIRALELVGDRDSLACLHYWSHRDPYGEKEARLKAAAIRAQEALRERLKQEEQAGMLLRGSQPADSGSLLHPVMDSLPADQALLRPTSDTDSDSATPS